MVTKFFQESENISSRNFIALFAIVALTIVPVLTLAQEEEDEEDGDPPRVALGPADVFNDSVNVHGYATPNTGGPTRAWFEYGPTSSVSYATNTIWIGYRGKNVPFMYRLESLDPDRTYYYRAVASNPNGTVKTEIATFRTAPLEKAPSSIQDEDADDDAADADAIESGAAPIVITKIVSQISQSSVRLSGLALRGTATDAMGYFEWGRTSPPLTETDSHDLPDRSSAEFSDELTNLSPATTYYYRAVLETSEGITRGGTFSFRTLPAASAAEADDVEEEEYQDEYEDDYVDLTRDTPATPSPPSLTIKMEVSGLCPEGCSSLGTGAVISGGSSVEYTIRVSNVGSGVISNGLVEVDVPEEFAFLKASDGGEYEETSGIVSWDLPSLRSGGSKTLTLELTASPVSEIAITETRALIKAGSSTGQSENLEMVVLPSQGFSLLALSFADVPARVAPGATYQYSLSLKNMSASPLEYQNVRVYLPSEADYAGMDSSWRKNGNVLVLKPGTLAAGESKRFSFKARIGGAASEESSLAVFAAGTYKTSSGDSTVTSAHALSSVDQQGEASLSEGGRFANILGGGIGALGGLANWLIIIILFLLGVLGCIHAYEKLSEFKKRKEEHTMAS